MGVVTLNIQYCGGWGYGKYFDSLAAFLYEQFDDSEIALVAQEDRGTTGNFEITHVESGKLIHSKRQGRGQGKCTSPRERKELVEYIVAQLED